jgi:chromosome partitioning protein
MTFQLSMCARSVAELLVSRGLEAGLQPTSFEQCVQSEQTVREQLKKEWSTFATADKSHCVTLARYRGFVSNLLQLQLPLFTAEQAPPVLMELPEQTRLILRGAQVHILVLASQKGGTGKTTLSGHLAVEAQKAGVGPVALIDTDPQGSLSHWWNARKASEPLFVKVGLLELGETLEHLSRSGIRLAVIDTPPAITESIAYVIGHADLVILPTRPSPHDLRAVGPTVDIAGRHGKPLLFVVKAATQRARITGEAAVALSQHGTVAPITIHHRVDFAASMVDGRTVGEVTAESPSAKEIQELWIYVHDRLARLKHDNAFAPASERQNFAISSLSPADGSEAVDADDAVEPMDTSVAPPSAMPDSYSGVERGSGLDRKRVIGEAQQGFDNRRVVKTFGRALLRIASAGNRP